eukprot:917750_1
MTVHNDTIEYQWCNRIIGAILEIIILSLFLIHLYKTYVWRFKTKTRRARSAMGGPSTSKWRNYSHVFTMLTLFSYNVMGSNYVFNIWGVYGPSVSCETVEIFSVFSYHMCKCFLYIVLILRIKVAFSESVYYQTILKILYFLYIMLLSYFLVICFGDFIMIHGTISYVSAHIFYCKLLPMPRMLCFSLCKKKIKNKKKLICVQCGVWVRF